MFFQFHWIPVIHHVSVRLIMSIVCSASVTTCVACSAIAVLISQRIVRKKIIMMMITILIGTGKKCKLFMLLVKVIFIVFVVNYSMVDF